MEAEAMWSAMLSFVIAAVKDVLKRKLMSNEFSALRVWEGSY